MVNNIAKLKCSYTTTTEWNKQIQNLWGLYINNFTPSSRTKKQNYIVWSILYITETIDYVIPLIDRPELLFQSLLGFDKIIVTLKPQQVIRNNINNNLLNVFRFILLLFVQVFIFNNINLLGYINPFPYILFILLFPVNGNKSLLLLSSFTLGLLIDIFSNCIITFIRSKNDSLCCK